MKICRVCKKNQPLDSFYRAAGAKDGYRGECKQCMADASRARREANPGVNVARVKQWQADNRDRHLANQRRRYDQPDVKARERQAHLLRKYGLTAAEWQSMLDAQGGVCAVCAGGSGDTQLHVDHDHVTGKVRGILCGLCNRAIGALGDSAERVISAARYLSGDRTGAGSERL